MSSEHKRLYKEIDEILWNDWDPISVNADAPRDEYQSYTLAIFSQKIKGVDIEEIAQRLYEFEQIEWVWVETLNIVGRLQKRSMS